MADIEKDLSISFLFDFYGELLTDIQKEAIDFYFNQDLSLAEIAQHSGITRQGVRDSIKRGERQLLDFEEKLGLYKKYANRTEELEAIQDCCLRLLDENRRVGASPLIELEGKRILDLVTQLKT